MLLRQAYGDRAFVTQTRLDGSFELGDRALHQRRIHVQTLPGYASKAQVFEQCVA